MNEFPQKPSGINLLRTTLGGVCQICVPERHARKIIIVISELLTPKYTCNVVARAKKNHAFILIPSAVSKTPIRLFGRKGLHCNERKSVHLIQLSFEENVWVR